MFPLEPVSIGFVSLLQGLEAQQKRPGFMRVMIVASQFEDELHLAGDKPPAFRHTFLSLSEITPDQ